MKGGVTAANPSRLDLDNVIDFLATVQRKERSAAYRQNDYLRSRRRYHDCTYIEQNYDLASTAACNNKNENWEISISGRTQVGQWFYKSKLRLSCCRVGSEFIN
jgi:hypothetical protein